jgi:hypothetical protein
MSRRNPNSTGYVARKIRAHTARKNSSSRRNPAQGDDGYYTEHWVKELNRLLNHYGIRVDGSYIKEGERASGLLADLDIFIRGKHQGSLQLDQKRTAHIPGVRPMKTSGRGPRVDAQGPYQAILQRGWQLVCGPCSARDVKRFLEDVEEVGEEATDAINAARAGKVYYEGDFMGRYGDPWRPEDCAFRVKYKAGNFTVERSPKYGELMALKYEEAAYRAGEH